jgi:predicted DNA-binding protein with PD1-like motif
MPQPRIVLLFLACSLAALAQRTQKEIFKPTTPALDAKANSADVPDVVAISARIDRVVVLRFKYMADLLAGIEKAVKDEKIQNAVILSGAGSVRNYHVHSVSNRTFPSKNTFTKDPTAPADIVSMNGYVLNGKVHAHMTMTDTNKAFGGHLEPDTNVFTFAIVTLGVFSDGVDLSRLDDKTWR